MEGHGTEAMAPSMRQEQAIWSPPGVVQTAMIAENLHYHGHLNLFLSQSKKYFNLKEWNSTCLMGTNERLQN